MAAEECNTLDFDSASDMWFGGSDNLFSCPEKHGGSEALFGEGDGDILSPVTYLGTFLKVRWLAASKANSSWIPRTGQTHLRKKWKLLWRCFQLLLQYLRPAIGTASLSRGSISYADGCAYAPEMSLFPAFRFVLSSRLLRRLVYCCSTTVRCSVSNVIFTVG